MSTIRIYSKKAFAIGPGAQRGTTEIESFVTRPGTFQEMPAKYENDPTFKLAVKSGDITVIVNSTAEKQTDGSKANINDKAGMTEEQAFYAELKGMSIGDTYKLAEEKYGLTPENNEKLGAFKKRIMQAYKDAAEKQADE